MKKIIFKTPDALASAFADQLVKLSSDKQVIHVALSGGSTPKLLFEILANKYKNHDWSRLRFYWGDERCVGPDDSESNYLMAKTLFFDPANIPSEHIFRILGENNPKQEAQRYGNLLYELLPLVTEMPCFDLIYLGMGGDGHTASIFPHEMELMKHREVCAVATHPISGQKRVTLTGPVINNARSIVFLITGKAKYPRIKSILKDQRDFENLPAAYIKPTHGHLTWYLDDAAYEGT
jgi:6-phosphogluconolactonase